MAEHKDLTGSNLHEPKGVATASNNTVYVADGAGSGSWSKVGVNSIDNTSILDVNDFYMTEILDDVSTASSTYMAVPVGCQLVKIYGVLQNTIASGDPTISFSIGGISVTGGDLTFTASGSAAGDVESATPSANNSLSAGGVLRIQTDGASTNTVPVVLTLTFRKV